MQRTQTYAANQQVLAAELNALQDQAQGLNAGANNNAHTTLTAGTTAIEWMYDTATLGPSQLIKVDGSIDWRDRILTVAYGIPAASDWNPGASRDFEFDFAPVLRRGYTGLGALGAASAPVTPGVPPVTASGSSWALKVDVNVWLYAAPSTGELYLYNGTAGTLRRPILTVTATAKTGQR